MKEVGTVKVDQNTEVPLSTVVGTCCLIVAATKASAVRIVFFHFESNRIE